MSPYLIYLRRAFRRAKYATPGSLRYKILANYIMASDSALIRHSMKMRKLIPLLMVLLSPLSAVEFMGVDYSEQDKQGHFILGAATASISMLAYERFCEARHQDPPAWWQSAAVGIASSVVVGAVKEWSDSRDPNHHSVDRDDFIATTTGGAAVSLTLCWRF